MIAIIGNKGSGKSALADIIALAGNTLRRGGFLVSRQEKIPSERSSPSQFRGDGPSGRTARRPSHNLQDEPDPNDAGDASNTSRRPILRRFAPRRPWTRGSAFQHELRKVIFSHISDASGLAGIRSKS